MDRNIIQNVNGIVKVKNELKNLLIILGMEPNNNFEEYAGLFRQKLEQIQNLTQYITGD